MTRGRKKTQKTPCPFDSGFSKFATEVAKQVDRFVYNASPTSDASYSIPTRLMQSLVLSVQGSLSSRHTIETGCLELQKIDVQPSFQTSSPPELPLSQNFCKIKSPPIFTTKMIHNLVFHPPFHLLKFASYHLWLLTVLVMFSTSAPLYLIRFVLSPSSFWTPPPTFYQDVLFDDNEAVDAAWTKLAHNLGKDPAKVISASHGKSVTDAMAQLRPFITRRRLEFEVAKFEESILDFADTPQVHELDADYHSSWRPSTPLSSDDTATPSSIPDNSSPNSRRSSISSVSSSSLRRPSFANNLQKGLFKLKELSQRQSYVQDDDEMGDILECDCSIRALPGIPSIARELRHEDFAVVTTSTQSYGEYFCSYVIDFR
ncbi:hypothetical protein D9758_002511 [Tetrapyrgos nigripes]|uniref:Uncharacterized protein n=1 Tax=Tetrapyrgos nigripes TaxID=182062 RepID=A0A8H5LU74_9AGAR|nr:hypothetical protein D9758_002511 [Tetrapyrgos nigripes]